MAVPGFDEIRHAAQGQRDGERVGVRVTAIQKSVRADVECQVVAIHVVRDDVARSFQVASLYGATGTEWFGFEPSSGPDLGMCIPREPQHFLGKTYTSVQFP